MKHIFRLFAAGLLVVNLSSCEKVININVKNSEATLIINASITDQPGPYTVSLSKSVNFSANNTFPSVDGAVVVMTDNAGNIDTLTPSGNGIYHTNTISGMSGRTYTLTVNAEGKQYVAVSTMPTPIPFDSLVIDKSALFVDSVMYPAVIYHDPVGVENYYRFVEYRNEERVKSNFVRSDRLSDGKRNKVILRNSDYELVSGDSVYLEMHCIDKDVYKYLNSLNDVDGNTQTAAPSNPQTNFTNFPLGYFSAHTVSAKSIIVL